MIDVLPGTMKGSALCPTLAVLVGGGTVKVAGRTTLGSVRSGLGGGGYGGIVMLRLSRLTSGIPVSSLLCRSGPLNLFGSG